MMVIVDVLTVMVLKFYQMFNSVIERLQAIALELDTKMPDIIETICMQEFEAEWKNRIFGTGNTEEKYSTTPIYVNKEKFVRSSAFKGAGKKGNQTKTMYIQGGYAEFRSIQGRKTDAVYSKLTGSLERAFRVYKIGNSVLFGNADELESKKFKGLSQKYGGFYEANQKEKEILINSIKNNAVIVSTS